ncbi:hypothetical protein IFM89_022755 [Coptis chinensis]|uniref:DUF4216 domain-containing protein n=1 Tax=Coptis chinensis TaxID=261450 RepID=A0A835LMG5_9MAGN|nr:hypothetical protein IFM89_022755 [Coptis chinensis]
MMSCMEYIHDGNLGSHKNGRRVIINEDIESAHPMDKKGKQCVLPNIEYQQVQEVGFDAFSRKMPSGKTVSYNEIQPEWVCFYRRIRINDYNHENSGVSMKVVTSFRASAKDRNLVDDEVRIEDKTNGCTVDPDTNLVFVNLGRFMRNTSEVDEPFILASEAKQVFYCRDLSRDNWHVVLDAPKRLSQEIDAYEDPLVFEARTSANDSSSTTLIEDALEVAEDWI